MFTKPQTRVLMVLGVMALAVPAVATDQSKMPNGANFEVAHGAPYNATGGNIPIAQLDAHPSNSNKRGIDPNNNNLGNRLKLQVDFLGKTPGQQPAVLAPTAANASDHARLVADVAAGDANGNFLGVAKEAHIYLGESVDQNSTFDQDYDAFRTATNWFQLGDAAATPSRPRISLFNMSMRFDGANDNGANKAARYADWFMRTRDALIVKSAGNSGGQISIPGDFYNGITVGALADGGVNGFRTREVDSSYWLQGDAGIAPDIRGKPDIVAPGEGIGDGIDSNTGTSFAAPHVTGTAALLMERGMGMGNPTRQYHLGIKAIIMNTARKRGAGIINRVNAFALDHANTGAQASDEDYLQGANTLRQGGTPGTAPPPHPSGEWSPTKWVFDGNLFSVDQPLDDELGTGVLDAQRALVQFHGGVPPAGAGEQFAGTVSRIGWNLHFLRGSDAPSRQYCIDEALPRGTFITTTLAWDRVVDEVNGQGGMEGVVDASDTYSAGLLYDLDLNITFRGDLIARSWSRNDNVEHLHFPVWMDGNAGDYCIVPQIYPFAGIDPTISINYGLAWWTPEPATVLLLAAGGLAVRNRRRTRRR